MSGKLFTMIDDSVSRVSHLSMLVDKVLNWLTPKAVASAVACSGLRYAQNCLDVNFYAYYSRCGGSSDEDNFYAGFWSTVWFYNNGRKVVRGSTPGSGCKGTIYRCPSSNCT